MEAYTLKPNEIMLYRGEATLDRSKVNGEVILTNKNVVAITKSKKMFSKEQVELHEYPVEGMCVINQIPQIKQSEGKVDIGFNSGEVTLYFSSESEGRKFVNAVYEIVTGQSAPQRNAAKVKDALNYVNNALGFNAVDTVVTVMERGLVGTLLGGLGKVGRANTSVSSLLLGRPSTAEPLLYEAQKNVPGAPSEAVSEMSVDDQIETLRKLKLLLNDCIITQEEFDAKKKQVLGL
ncbi:MAG: SHOCT domain-containing protein [Christensenellales bacterium]